MFSKNKSLVVMAVAAAAALSGCGRDDYNGKYTGYEQQVQAQSTTTSTGGSYGGYYGGYGMMADQRVELDLHHDGDIVSGTITYPDSGQQGQFSASAENANKLDNVEVRIGYNYNQQGTTGYQGGYGQMGGSYMMNCMGTFRGGLDAPGDGKRLTGTLSAVNTSQGAFGYSTCSGKSLTVNKTN